MELEYNEDSALAQSAGDEAGVSPRTPPPSTWFKQQQEDKEPEPPPMSTTSIPVELAVLGRNGMRFKKLLAYIWGLEGEEQGRLHKELSVNFSVDTLCTSQDICDPP